MLWTKPTDHKHQVLGNNNLFGEPLKVVALIKIFPPHEMLNEFKKGL